MDFSLTHRNSFEIHPVVMSTFSSYLLWSTVPSRKCFWWLELASVKFVQLLFVLKSLYFTSALKSYFHQVWSSELRRFSPSRTLSTVFSLALFLTGTLPSSLFSCFCVCCYCCSVAKSCPTLCNPMDCSTPGSSVLHYLLEFAQMHVH